MSLVYHIEELGPVVYLIITTPQVERKWNAGGNCIPSANYRVQAEGHFALPKTYGVCVCGCNYMHLQNPTLYQKVHVE